MRDPYTMTKADQILIVTVMILALVMIVPVVLWPAGAKTAVVKVRSDEVLRIDLSRDGEYTVDGTLGDVKIEVKDQAVRVEQENSSHHYCSMQGFVDSPNTPIVCLPNDTVITIEGEQDGEDVQIQ
ncbi:NusG domain II-containing protein [uncultured Dubosiella sp.]|uniref:NusG domain II-containing protein n=1 Tax=uncultured Dubosiella sp. TaxID=1937011 RepID=UPI003447958F